MTSLVDTVMPYTLTGRVRCRAMIVALEYIEAEGIEGDIVECGVWRGGNIILARQVCPDRVCWLYDTFTGMVEPGPEDTKVSTGKPASKDWARRKDNWCKASLGEVRNCLGETGTLDDEKLRFVAGDVCKTLRQQSNLPDRISLLRLDTDFYASTRMELEVLYPRLESGGVLIVDDYGHWMGARKAVDEYFGEVKWEQIDYSAVMMIKP